MSDFWDFKCRTPGCIAVVKAKGKTRTRDKYCYDCKIDRENAKSLTNEELKLAYKKNKS